ncbi:5-hydroxytryptamine receptor 7-like [Dendronephthya gigantea]|uniref:5-hydroxytryptamine receptor 7-like n=1 Tax=Dendronephthya gigantea TaxID=151771 RepID=UPI001069DFFF|nr:5-hydroxytryptamine receptor 7-like [Dendronephthya gigantea]
MTKLVVEITMEQRNITNQTKSEQVSFQFMLGLVIFKCISIVLGVLGNTAVIIYNVFMNKEKSPTTWLIVNLSVTDLLVCLTIYPIWIVELLQIVTGVESNEEFFCKFIYSSGSVSVFLSILTLLALSFDRYLFITWPLKYPILVVGKRVYALVFIIWIWSFSFLPLPLMYIGPGEVPGVCRASNEFILFSFIVYVYTPLTLIIFFNIKILKIARRQRRRIAACSITRQTPAHTSTNTAQESVGGRFVNEQHDQNTSWQRITKELKPLKTFVIIIGVLLGCFIPYSIAVCLEKLGCNCIPLKVHIIFSEFIAVNSIINPFIYGIRHKKYRNAYGRILRMICKILNC